MLGSRAVVRGAPLEAAGAWQPRRKPRVARRLVCQADGDNKGTPDYGEALPEVPKQRRRRRKEAQPEQPFSIESINPVTSERLLRACRSQIRRRRRQCASPCGGLAAAPPPPPPPPATPTPLAHPGVLPRSACAVGRKSREVFDDVWTQLQRIGNPTRSTQVPDSITCVRPALRC